MSELDDDYVADDFYSLVGNAQLNELKEIEKAREEERELQKQLAAKQNPNAMSLMALAGLRSQKELEVLAEQKNADEDKRLQDEQTKRKEMENARLVTKFPPPNL